MAVDIESLKDEDAFKKYISDLNKERRYLHEPFPDWVEPVPETILWFVKDHDYIGLFRIRHRLNWHLEKWGGHLNILIRPSMRGKGFGKKLLQKGMPFICYFGIDRALITVEPDNDCMSHILEFCGATLQDTTQGSEQFPPRKRYWLDCT